MNGLRFAGSEAELERFDRAAFRGILVCMKPYNPRLKTLFQKKFPGIIDAKLGRQCAKLYSKTVAPYSLGKD